MENRLVPFHQFQRAAAVTAFLSLSRAYWDSLSPADQDRHIEGVIEQARAAGTNVGNYIRRTYYWLRHWNEQTNRNLGIQAARDREADRRVEIRREQNKERKRTRTNPPPPPPEEDQEDMADIVNPQFVSRVRHSRSNYGRRRRRTTAYLARLQERDYAKVKSFSQSFLNDGFQQGQGPMSMQNQLFATSAPVETTRRLPMYLLDISSFPAATYSGEGREEVSGASNVALTAVQARPARMFQLCCYPDPANTDRLMTFRWQTVRSARSATNADTKPVAETTDLKGNLISLNQFPFIAGFRHDYSKLQMTFYPGTSLPCKWHVALVTFPTKNGINCGPSQTFYDYTNNKWMNTNNTDCTPYISQLNDDNIASLVWKKFFSGKLYHPNLKDDTIGQENADKNGPKYPFKILKYETFDHPARDNPTFGSNVNESGLRILKDIFYRADKWYRPSDNAIISGENLKRVDNYEHYTRVPSVDQYQACTPFGDSEKTVYCAIWCEHYKVGDATVPDIPTGDHINVASITPSVPSFDYRLEMKHSVAEDNYKRAGAFGVPPDGAAPT